MYSGICNTRGCLYLYNQQTVERLMPESYQQYILNVINSNRENPYFTFDYICKNPIRKTELFHILEKQLEQMNVENKECFEEIRLIEKKVDGLN